RHVEDAGEGLGEQRLAGAGGADEQDVALLELGLVGLLLGGDALVVVVDRNRDDLLGEVLTDDVVVEDRPDLLGLGHLALTLLALLLLVLLGEDVVAEGDALVADVHRRTRDELLDLLLALAAEGAAQISVPGISLGGAHAFAGGVEEGLGRRWRPLVAGSSIIPQGGLGIIAVTARAPSSPSPRGAWPGWRVWPGPRQPNRSVWPCLRP